MPYQVSSQFMSTSLRQSLLRMQAELTARSTELATGKHADTALFLGGRAGTLVSFKAEKALLATIIGTNELALTRLGTTETILEQMQNSAQSLLNTLIAGRESASNAGAIEAIGKVELAALIARLNSSLQGDFIFAGTDTSTKPIADYFGTPAAGKQAVDDAFLAAFGVSQADPAVAGISGTDMQTFLDNQFADLFEDPRWGSGWSSAADQPLSQQITPTQWASTSVSANERPFRQLAEAYTMLADLGVGKFGPDAVRAVTAMARDLLSSAISGLTQLRTSVGISQSSVANARSQMTIQSNLLSTHIGALESVDAFEVAARITELQTRIETSYALTSKIRQLSLVHYL